ncbi:MAG: ACT domain-containing protein [Chromatocurvus sp.]
MQPVKDLTNLLACMRPELNPGRYAFVTLPEGYDLDDSLVVASICEAEGRSVILPEQIVQSLGLPAAFTAAWITLKVHSDLAAVGLTAAFSTALAESGISCNVVAGVHHDHLFVPLDRAQQAMDTLIALSRSAQ